MSQKGGKRAYRTSQSALCSMSILDRGSPSLKRLGPVQARCHAEQILDRDRLLVVVEIDDRSIGEKVHDTVIWTVEQRIFKSNCDQRADD